MTEYQPLIQSDEKKMEQQTSINSATYEKTEVQSSNDEDREQMQKAQNAVSLATAQLKFASKFAGPGFYAIAIAALVSVILYAVDIGGSILFFVILGITYLGGSVGAYMTYKYGTLQEALKLLEKMNKEYSHEIDVLRLNSQTLSTEVNSVQSSVDGLQQNQEELQGHLKEFDELQQQLQSICKDNESISDTIYRMNNIMYDMKDVIRRNESAQLLSLYYDCAFRDGTLGLSKDEYSRFLGRLSINQRKRFENLGTFDQLLTQYSDSNEMSLQTFTSILQTILEAMDEEYLAMIKQ